MVNGYTKRVLCVFEKYLTKTAIMIYSFANNETESLLVDAFFDMKPLKLPPDAWKDFKKLNRFLGDV